MKNGNTTKSPPRGVGIDWLLSFAKVNSGYIRICNENVLFEQNQDGDITYKKLNNNFYGLFFEMHIMEDVIKFDFSNVKFFTTLFFNIAFTRLLREMTFEEYNKKIVLENLSEVGKRAYEYSLENAKRFAAMTKEERETREQIIAEILADE